MELPAPSPNGKPRFHPVSGVFLFVCFVFSFTLSLVHAETNVSKRPATNGCESCTNRIGNAVDQGPAGLIPVTGLCAWSCGIAVSIRFSGE